MLWEKMEHKEKLWRKVNKRDIHIQNLGKEECTFGRELMVVMRMKEWGLL